MSLISWDKWKRGEKISRKQAIQAQCYECNGYTILKADDCLAKHFPLYGWSPWGLEREKKPKRRTFTGWAKKYNVDHNP